MTDIDQAKATQLRNIEAKTGRSFQVLCDEIRASGKTKHGDIRRWAMEIFGLGYGDANALAHAATGHTSAPNTDEDPLQQIYSGKKEHLRPIHDQLIGAISLWGEFEIAPKKAYVAFRRKKQFAMLGPKNANTAELGINLKEDVVSSRIVQQKPGGMYQYAVPLTEPKDLDQEVLSVLQRAFDAAG
jgi:predicted transport protein